MSRESKVGVLVCHPKKHTPNREGLRNKYAYIYIHIPEYLMFASLSPSRTFIKP